MYYTIDNFFVIFVNIIIFMIAVTTILTAISNVIRANMIHNAFKKSIIDPMSGGYKKEYRDVTKKQLETFNTDDLSSLKNYVHDTFLKFENAYNNLDYNTMKQISTKQLFENYYTGITLDLKSGKKRIISEPKIQKIVIFELDSTAVKQTFSAMVEISYINYMMNNNGQVINGNNDTRITEKFEVTFRKDFQKEDVVKCPNCGAAVIGNKCEYCRTTIQNVDFKISSIKRIVEE